MQLHQHQTGGWMLGDRGPIPSGVHPFRHLAEAADPHVVATTSSSQPGLALGRGRCLRSEHTSHRPMDSTRILFPPIYLPPARDPRRHLPLQAELLQNPAVAPQCPPPVGPEQPLQYAHRNDQPENQQAEPEEQKQDRRVIEPVDRPCVHRDLAFGAALLDRAGRRARPLVPDSGSVVRQWGRPLRMAAPPTTRSGSGHVASTHPDRQGSTSRCSTWVTDRHHACTMHAWWRFRSVVSRKRSVRRWSPRRGLGVSHCRRNCR